MKRISTQPYRSSPSATFLMILYLYLVMDENICIFAMPAPAVGPVLDFIIQQISSRPRLMKNF